MAKGLTIKNKNNLILYPKTVSSLVYDNSTGNTVKQDLDSLIGQVAELLGVENAFFGGIVGASTDIATDYTNNEYSGTYLYMVGTDMSSLVAYQYTGSSSPTQLFGGTTYDFTDYSEVKQEVAQLGSKIESEDTIDLSNYETINQQVYQSKWVAAQTGKIIPVLSGRTYKFVKGNGNIVISILKDNSHITGNTPNFATGYSDRLVITNALYSLIMPSDANYVYIQTTISSNDITPQVILLGDVFVRVANVEESLNPNSINPAESKAIFSHLEELLFSDITDFSEIDYSILINGTFGSYSEYKHIAVRVKEEELYIIQAPQNGATTFCFATSNSASSSSSIPLVSNTSVVSLSNGEKAQAKIPSGCKFLLVYNGGNTRPFYVEKIKICKEEVSIIRPKLSCDYIGGVTGDFSINDARTTNGLWYSTPRFIKTNNINAIKANRDCTLQIYYFDEDKTFLKVQASISLNANSLTTITPNTNGYHFVKLSLGQSQQNSYKEITIELVGIFEKEWDTYNNIPSDNGYHPINTVVNITNPSSDYQETQTIQDSYSPIANYGLLALPNTYSEYGEPTRLIIYCHGAGTHFPIGTNRFNTNTHIDPEYWLAEGYAIMDMDGNPFDTTNAHAFIPQAIDCYVAGYNWVIEHYNIKKNGVFLGGRSMGGGNTLNLIRQQCPIPIIAACANLPTSLAMSKDATAKAFGATHRGFVLPDGFTWSNGTDEAPYNSNEKQVIINNWDKFVRWQPITALIIDLPTNEQWRLDFIDSCTLNNENRITIMKDLHAIVKCPLKMFSCNQDPNNTLETAAGLYKRIFNNSGYISELRVFDSFKDYTGTGYTAHYYELQDPALRTSTTTIYGNVISNVPILYIEMLQFWRRYEQ